MNKLVFNATEVKRVVEHAIETKGNVMLVHDQGVYLISNGKPLDKIDEQKNYVVYAHGCNPETDADWYDTAHALVGGDDFAEELPFKDDMKEQIDLGVAELVIQINETDVQLMKQVLPMRKCIKCGKLLKRDHEGDVCPKCLEKEQPPAPTNEASEPQVKPGQAIREMFVKLIEANKNTPSIIEIVTDAEKTKNELGIRYAFLKEYPQGALPKDVSLVNGHARYSSKPVIINDKRYLITNDLYKKNVEKFTEWYEGLIKAE
jgi:hypothetical protein